MLNKYNNFLNSCCKSSFGDIPLKLSGSYKFEKYENNNISFQDKILVEKFSISNENISKFLTY